MNDQEPAPGRHRMLEEAQKLLMARRAAMRQARKRQSECPSFCDPPHPLQLKTENGKWKAEDGEQSAVNSQQLAELVSSLPQHLGWDSATQTAVLRAASKRRAAKQPAVNSQQPTVNSQQSTANSQQDAVDRAALDSVSLPPSLGLAILRRKKAAGARLWLLLRSIDARGSGVVALDRARKSFTGEDSPLRFCGKRQLSNLLAAGQGLFWEADDQRIWLRSVARVAFALDLDRFRGQEVAIPTSALTGGIGNVRANLYATFHSGRDAAPISRQTLARVSGIAPRTQRQYDRQSGVRKEVNYASGPAVGSREAEELAWRHGPAAFTWRDRRREQDGKNSRFLAWQLPNSYHGPHARSGRGRRKRQNMALADLLHTGTAGNGQSHKDDVTLTYFADARAASRAYNRGNTAHCQTAVYWPALTPGIWHCLWQPTVASARGQRGKISNS